MNMHDLNGKKICILGYGKEGQAMEKALQQYGINCQITIMERYQKDTTAPTATLHACDIIIKSPGIPPCTQLKKLGKKVTSSTQIFLDTVKEAGSVVIGITGSKGKSTTSNGIHAILQEDDRDTWLVGNIGIPAISQAHHARPLTVFVLEMSSYQLTNVNTSPHIAVLTAFFPEHLDYHGSLQNYFEAKTHIARYQKKEDVVFYNKQYKELHAIAQMSKGKKVEFSEADAPVSLDETQLIGVHNLANIGGAWKVCESLGVSKSVAIQALRRLKGLPHRLENAGVYHGITWINDSISTAPQSTIAALRALENTVQTLIAGGQDRGYDFTPLAEEISRQSCLKNVILLPDSGKAIQAALMQILPGKTKHITIDAVSDMGKAVAIAKHKTEKGKICLLSPASPSYGYFKNFEERGNAFTTAVRT